MIYHDCDDNGGGGGDHITTRPSGFCCYARFVSDDWAKDPGTTMMGMMGIIFEDLRSS